MIKLVIDAGHGANDWGLRTGKTFNKGADGCFEKDINLEVAGRLAYFCSRHNLPYLMTRFGNRYITLTERCFRANSASPSLFLSIHCNYARNPKIYGLETWYYRGSYSGRGWASKFQASLSNLKYTRNRGIKGGTFYVLKHTAMPAVLIELGYLSNPDDCSFLNNEGNQDLVAETIFECVRTL